MRRLISPLLILVYASLTLACTHVHHPRVRAREVQVTRPGPPPHAPAHGYRHKHREASGVKVELAFDSSLGVYVVVGWPHHYYSDGRFYRQADGAWYVSTELESKWSVLRASALPRGLAKKAARGKSKKHKRGPHPAKHGY